MESKKDNFIWGEIYSTQGHIEHLKNSEKLEFWNFMSFSIF